MLLCILITVALPITLSSLLSPLLALKLGVVTLSLQKTLDRVSFSNDFT